MRLSNMDIVTLLSQARELFREECNLIQLVGPTRGTRKLKLNPIVYHYNSLYYIPRTIQLDRRRSCIIITNATKVKRLHCGIATKQLR